jgi:hypothetical protein
MKYNRKKKKRKKKKRKKKNSKKENTLNDGIFYFLMIDRFGKE